MATAAAPGSWSVIVLTGGAGRRLGGRDKATITVLGSPLLDRVVGGIPQDVPIVVAGPERPIGRHLEFRAEEPPGGGPVAGIAAAIPAIGTQYVALIAVDIPWSPPLVIDLIGELAATEDDAVIPVDTDGRRQLLCSAWRTASLLAALNRLGDPRDRAVRELVEGARIRERTLTTTELAMLDDIDTPEDLERAQRHVPSPTLGSEAGTG